MFVGTKLVDYLGLLLKMLSHTSSYLPYSSTLGAVTVNYAWAAGLDSLGSGDQHLWKGGEWAEGETEL